MLYAVPSVEPLRRVVGGYDRSVVDHVEAWFQQDIGDPEAEELEFVRHIAEQYIQGRLTGEVETEDHVRVVGVMAETLGFTAEQNRIADGDWMHRAWASYYEVVSADLPPHAASLYEMLLNGRAILGQRIESGGAYYAWLSGAEIDLLVQSLQRLEGKRPAVADLIEGFHRELLGWLREAQSRQGELWVYAT
jgi:hypothetical protein